MRGSTHEGRNIQSPVRVGDKVVAKDCVFDLDVCQDYKDYAGHVTGITGKYIHVKNLNGDVIKRKWGPCVRLPNGEEIDCFWSGFRHLGAY